MTEVSYLSLSHLSLPAPCWQGQNPGELRGFELAAEEISLHIIDSYLPQSDGDFFTIFCRSAANGLEFSFEDKGLPINTEKVLLYDAAVPDKFLDGLSFHIVRSVCDTFELKNQGKDGWMLTFFKSIKKLQRVCPREMQRLRP